MTKFDPGMALEWGERRVIGLRTAEIDPAGPSGRAFGLGNGDFEPRKALR